MLSQEHGLSPSEQIQVSGVKRLESRTRDYVSLKPELREGTKYLFENDNAFYHPETGAIILRRFGIPRQPDKKGEKWIIPVILSSFSDIESAIASTWHVAEAYNPMEGSQTLKDQAVFNKSGEVLEFLDNTPIIDDERQELEMDIGEFLDTVGYKRARHPDRIRSGEMLEASVRLDSRGKNNPEAKKTQASVSKTSTKHLGKVNEQIHTKYDQQLHDNLVMEREETRKEFVRAIDAINRTLEYRKLHARFRREVLGLIKKIPDLLGHNIVRVGGYRKTAQEVLALLVRDSDDRTEKIMEGVLGEEVFNQYKEMQTLKDFLERLDAYPVSAKSNITLHLREARSQLQAELTKGKKRMSDELKKRDKRLAEAVKTKTSV